MFQKTTLTRAAEVATCPVCGHLVVRVLPHHQEGGAGLVQAAPLQHLLQELLPWVQRALCERTHRSTANQSSPQIRLGAPVLSFSLRPTLPPLGYEYVILSSSQRIKVLNAKRQSSPGIH